MQLSFDKVYIIKPNHPPISETQLYSENWFYPVTSSVTPVPVTTPYAATGVKTAARALQMVTAGRTTYGQAQIAAQVTLFLNWIRAIGILQALVAAAGVLLPTHLLCAVSWICFFQSKKYLLQENCWKTLHFKFFNFKFSTTDGFFI